jgi:adenosine deaminase
VIPEAFLLGNGSDLYSRVTVVTTSGTDASTLKCKHWFEAHYPDVILRVFTVADLPDLSCRSDHEKFEEALYRCYFDAIKTSDRQIHVCLAGGFKTMSSSAHQVADLLGCQKLFHLVTSQEYQGSSGRDLFERIDKLLTTNDIDELKQCVHLIELGDRPGWPTIRELISESPQVPELGGELNISEKSLHQKIYNRLRDASHLSASEADLANLPFPQIARWPPSQRDWLEQPLNSETDADWVRQLPKLELHCHLGGFATHGELLNQVEKAKSSEKIPPRKALQLPSKWPLPLKPCGLENYMKFGDNNGSRLLKDPGCLKKHIQLLYSHLQDENILYAEIRCSPANYATDERSAWTVLSDIREAFQACMNTSDAKPHINLIIIATRKPDDKGDFRSDISRHLSLAVTAAEHWKKDDECRVVGVDLAGYEHKTTRPHYFREEFLAVHRCGLALTIHAGENDDAESIWRAVFDLNTRRIGHALHLIDSPDLLRSVANRGICVEMCPYANYQIKGFAPMTQSAESSEMKPPPPYPLLKYLNAGVPVTVNTDNPGISAASLSENFLLLPQLCPGLKRLDILRLIRNSIDQAFVSKCFRKKLLTQIKVTPYRENV